VAARDTVTTEHGTVARELLAAERLLLDSRGGFQRSAPYILLAINLFGNGYLHPLMREDPGGHMYALFFFLKSSALAALFLHHHLAVSETILSRIDHLPVSGTSRFLFVLLGALRTPAIAGMVATDLLFLLVIFGWTPAAAVALGGLSLLALGTIASVGAAALGLRRSPYPVTMLAALGALGFVAVTTLLVVFRADLLLPVLPLVWLTERAVSLALAGRPDQALVPLGALGIVSGALLALARKLS
jgi:hypothetical protein